MRKTTILSSVTLSLAVLAIAAAGSSGAAFAKPPAAAVAESGQGCLVADANGAYSLDPNCEYHIVSRRDGGIGFVSYQDHGQLPENAPHPATARTNAVSYTFEAEHTTCVGTETTLPSGEYRSDCRFNASR